MGIKKIVPKFKNHLPPLFLASPNFGTIGRNKKRGTVCGPLFIISYFIIVPFSPPSFVPDDVVLLCSSSKSLLELRLLSQTTHGGRGKRQAPRNQSLQLATTYNHHPSFILHNTLLSIYSRAWCSFLKKNLESAR